jgi:hypothetical protein
MKKIMIYGGMVLLLGGSLIVAPQQAPAQTPAVLDGTPGGETGGDGNGGFGDGPVVPINDDLTVMILSAALGYGLRVSKKATIENCIKEASLKQRA